MLMPDKGGEKSKSKILQIFRMSDVIKPAGGYCQNLHKNRAMMHQRKGDFMNDYRQFKSADNSDWCKQRIFMGIMAMVFFCFGLFLAMPAEALRLETSWAQRVDLSENIIRGKVVGVKSYWNEGKTMISTDVTVVVEEYIKGDGPKEITITIPGGTVGEDNIWISDTAHFNIGDNGIILLEPSGHITGGPDGVYLFEEKSDVTNQPQLMAEDSFITWIRAYINGQTQISFEEIAEESFGIPSVEGASYATISGVSPSSISAGTGSVLTISGSGFGTSRGSGDYPTIAFRYKNQDYVFNNTKIQSWSDATIKAEVFTFIHAQENYHYSPGSWSDTVAFVNSSGTIGPFFSLTITFGYGQAKWGASSVSYYINSSGGPSGAESEIKAAAITWNGSGSKFAFSYAGSSSSGFVLTDGRNVISFGDLGSNTIIAQAGTRSSGGTILECDIRFNTGFPWSTASPTPIDRMDLQTIALHELGHWLKLLDLYGANDSAKAMYGYGSKGQTKRSLASGDKEGIQWIYEKSSNETISVPSVPSGLATGNTGTSYTYTTGGSTSSIGDAIQYHFDWGDGSYSDWSSSLIASKSWTNAGSYNIKVQARCATHTSIVSSWSNPLNVTIVAAGPDLVGDWLYPSEKCKRGKCKVKLTLRVRNIGNRDAASTAVKIYVSDNNNAPDAGDILLAEGSTCYIMPGGSCYFNKMKATIPMTAAGKYIIAVIDPGNNIKELSETNNLVIYGPIP